MNCLLVDIMHQDWLNRMICYLSAIIGGALIGLLVAIGLEEDRPVGDGDTLGEYLMLAVVAIAWKCVFGLRARWNNELSLKKRNRKAS